MDATPETKKHFIGFHKKEVFGCCSGLFVLTIVLIIVAVATGASKSSSNSPQLVASGSQTATSTSTPSVAQDFKVGQTIAINGIDLKVNTVNLNYVPTNSFEDAAAGHQFVVVNVTLHNTSSSSVDYAEGDFKIQDSLGGQNTSNTITDLNNELSAFASMAAGGTVTGDLSFDVKSANASSLKVIYSPSFWDNQTATIDLN